MAPATILSDLPLSNNIINIGSLLRDLDTARQQLAEKHQSLFIQRGNIDQRMDEVDTLIGVILQTQVLLKQLVESGLVKIEEAN